MQHNTRTNVFPLISGGKVALNRLRLLPQLRYLRATTRDQTDEDVLSASRNVIPAARARSYFGRTDGRTLSAFQVKKGGAKTVRALSESEHSEHESGAAEMGWRWRRRDASFTCLSVTLMLPPSSFPPIAALVIDAAPTKFMTRPTSGKVLLGPHSAIERLYRFLGFCRGTHWAAHLLHETQAAMSPFNTLGS